MTNNKDTQVPDGLISLGYESPDYSQPLAPGEKSSSKTRTDYPSFRARGPGAAELVKALGGASLLDGEFAAIVVLKGTSIRAGAEDEEDENEVELTVKAIMPHVEDAAGETEEAIMADFEKLPQGKQEEPEEE
jgi:hypothetical protein